MDRPRVAIIGTGVAGLGCAHFLHPHCELTLFEQNNYIGGHTNTVTVDEAGRPVPIDTGFMVFNRVTYPLLCRLFAQLDVPTKPTNMSFSVQYTPTGLEYNGTSLNTLFGQRKNLLRPGFWKFLLTINRFNAEAVPALADPSVEPLTLKQYCDRQGYGQEFFDRYLVPMSSAVWSTPPELMETFPAITLLRFWHNHGFLGLHTQHPWWTVDGGAQSYVKRLIKPLDGRVRLNSPIARVERAGGRIKVTPQTGEAEMFDRVILASHADQTRAMLADPTPLEAELLAPFQYQPNEAILHTDTNVLPRTPRCWAAWNYLLTPQGPGGPLLPSTHYWMNRLQGVSDRENYIVSINGTTKPAGQAGQPGDHSINEDKVLRRIAYDHPLFDLPAIKAQQRLPELNRQPEGHTFFCGSYFRYGFHEDAFGSAVALCQDFLGRDPWSD